MTSWSMGRGALLGVAALSGCTLVDQRTFDPDAGKKPVPVAAPAVVPSLPPAPGAPPLLTVRPPTDPAALRQSVAKAVAAARAIKPDVSFRVLEITPDGRAGQEAGAVAQLILAQGVRPDRVELAAQPAPHFAREVRVYVR